MRCSCVRDGEDGRSGCDWKSGATFWLRFCAESAAPPAEETVIGSFYNFTASGTQTGQKQELNTQQIRTKNEGFFMVSWFSLLPQSGSNTVDIIVNFWQSRLCTIQILTLYG